MNKTATPTSRERWKHRITQLCGIPLIGPSIEQKRADLHEAADTGSVPRGRAN